MARKKKTTPQTAPQAPPSPAAARAAPLAIVGVGASAGGLDAFKRFFTHTPPDSGLAFVLIPHLDPTHESLMVELLARHTAMPVAEAEDGTRVESNHVYIIPPNKYMTIRDGVLTLTGPVERRGLAPSIDLFLRSLADDQQERAVCIVLSGTGSSGTLGLKAVKANGGMTMVQDPKTAQYDRMPQSAAATGLADYVLPPEQMPAALLKFVQHFYVNGNGQGTSTLPDPAVDSLPQILALLRVRTKYDFNCYRKKMLVRRIERRMGLSQFDQLPAYLKYLRENPTEVQQLTRDLFISVTNFFRDPDAFRALEEHVIAPLVRVHDSDRPIRVWIPACASGEEPYSVAMLLLEQLATAQRNCPIQIFATDVDEAALETARLGIYPESIATDVSPDRLARFFTRSDEHSYQVNKVVRESVMFAVQNLIADPPFSKLDLICCRNLLIYLEPEVQKKIVALFHFALNEGGYLFLGSSETVGRQTDLFEPVDKKWRLFRRIGRVRHDRVDFPIVGHGEKVGDRRHGPDLAGRERPINFADVAHGALLAAYAPAAVLINRRNEVLYFFGPTMRFLDQPTGEPTQDVMLLAREGLRTKLRVSVQHAVRDGRMVVERGVRMKRDGGYISVTITAQPVQAPRVPDGLLLVTFQDEIDAAPTPPDATPTAAEESLVRQLEYELKGTRDDLQSTIEEMESSNEELKAAHEEVMSMNEELQSANEELETSKEELQSLNEELNTVNSQLEEKVTDLDSLNNDLTNLLTSTDIATVFLDSSFRIKRFTPAATNLFNLIASDEGRPLGDIAPKFLDGNLLHDAETVLRQLTPIANEVSTPAGAWYLRRILPYRTTHNQIGGVVITFTDVTALKQAAEKMRRLATVLLDSNDAVTVHGFDGQITAWNRGAERMYGYTEAEALRMKIDRIVPDERCTEMHTLLERLRNGDDLHSLETRRVHKDGRCLDVWLTVTILKDDAGNPAAVATTERDVTERAAAERAARRQLAEIEAVYAGAPIGLAALDMNLRFVRVNKLFAEMTGLAAADHIGHTPREILPQFGDQFEEVPARVVAAGAPVLDIEITFGGPRGDRTWLYTGYPVKSATGQIQGVSAVLQDMTERKKMETELVTLNTRLEDRVSQRTTELKAANWALQEEITHRQRAQETAQRLAAIVESSDDAIVGKTLDGTVTSWNAGAERIYGHTAQEMIGKSIFDLVPPDAQTDLEAIHQRVARGDHIEHVEVRRIRKDGREIIVSLTNSPVRNQAGEIVGMSAIARDITRQKAMERAVRESEARLAAVVGSAGEGLIVIDEGGVIEAFNDTAETLFGYLAAEVIGKKVNVLMPTPYRDVHNDYLRNYLTTGVKKIIGIGREVVGRRKDGSTFPADLSISEFYKGDRRQFTGLIRDISKRKALEKDVLEVAAAEQRRIGQDLHDSVGQELTGLGLVAETLADSLTGHSHPEAPLAEKIAAAARRILAEVRALSRGLIPVEVDAAGLPTALLELAARVREQSKVACTFTCDEGFRWDDNVAATHYYRIAQEAVTNSLKHGRAKTLELHLGYEDGQIVLRVWNDGVPLRPMDPASEGMGLKIMRYRAGLIDAMLNISPSERGGTVVTCTFIKDKSHEQDRTAGG